MVTGNKSETAESGIVVEISSRDYSISLIEEHEINKIQGLVDSGQFGSDLNKEKHTEFPKVVLVGYNPTFLVLPKDYKGQTDIFFEALFGSVPDRIITNDCPTDGCQIAFVEHSTLLPELYQVFPNAHTIHVGKVMLELAKRIGESALLVMPVDGRTWLLHWHERKLQLINSFPTENDEEIAYYVGMYFENRELISDYPIKVIADRPSSFGLMKLLTTYFKNTDLFFPEGHETKFYHSVLKCV